jgi:hypothetical protein
LQTTYLLLNPARAWQSGFAMQTELQAAKQANTTKFRKGQSGNPRGRLDGQRYRETFAALAAELGGEASLSASQRVIVDQIAKLKASIGKRDPIRTANTVAKLIRLLKDNVAVRRKPGRPSLDDHIDKNYGTVP